jgi:hypothetical protein
MFLGNPATTIETIRNTLQIANTEGLAPLFGDCHINTNIRVFEYEEPDDDTLAVTYSVTPDLNRTAYQPIFPSYAYPPALLKHFGTEREIANMLGHIAETYLSTRYQETRNWFSFLRQFAAIASIVDWLAELSYMKRVRLPTNLKLTADRKAPADLHRLFMDAPSEEEECSLENLAKQVVDSLVAACFEAFPVEFGSLGLPTRMDQLERMTPYEFAKVIFSRWSTEDELIKELSRQTSSVLSGTMQDFIQFCLQAILYRSNILINPKYRELFLS